MAHSEISLATAAKATSSALTTKVVGAGHGATHTPNTSDETEGCHSRRRGSWTAGSGGIGSGGSGGGGGGGVTPHRRRSSRGFRDVEGEAIAVGAKVSELVRNKDVLEALRVFRLVQVSFA